MMTRKLALRMALLLLAVVGSVEQEDHGPALSKSRSMVMGLIRPSGLRVDVRDVLGDGLFP